jgi:hypothetical protein
LLLIPSCTYGSPDSHDQCGHYLEFTQMGIQKKFIIDPDQIPSYLKQTVEELSEEINKANIRE